MVDESASDTHRQGVEVVACCSHIRSRSWHALLASLALSFVIGTSFGGEGGTTKHFDERELASLEEHAEQLLAGKKFAEAVSVAQQAQEILDFGSARGLHARDIDTRALYVLASANRGLSNFVDAAVALRRICDSYARKDGLLLSPLMSAETPNGLANVRNQVTGLRRIAVEKVRSCNLLLLDTLHRLSEVISPRPRQQKLFREAFVAAQRAAETYSSAAFALGAARVLAKRRGAYGIAKRWEEVRERLLKLDDRKSDPFSDIRTFDPTNARKFDLNSQLGLDPEELALSDEYFALSDQLIKVAPDFFFLVRPEPLSVELLQETSGKNASALRGDEALILIVPSDVSNDVTLRRDALILIISKTKIGWASLPETVDLFGQRQPLAKVLASLEASARSGINMTARDKSLVPFDLNIAHALYQALFASSNDIRGVLDDPAIKTWVIAPQGEFISVPYATLVLNDPGHVSSRESNNLRAMKWLGIERTLTIVPSVSSLAIQRLNLTPRTAGVSSQTGRPEFLGFGDPDFARTGDTRDKCPPVVERERAETPSLDVFYRGTNPGASNVRELKRLPGTCQEIKTLADAFKAPEGNVVLGIAASEAGVRNHPRLSQARIIAFATHGLIAGSFHDTLAQPALAFTPPAMVKGQLPPSEDDGLLTSIDAASLDLQADWVLLSACDTAARDGNDPDGLSGLARGFFYAGARSLLVSRWPVNDEAGMRLTTKAAEMLAKNPNLTRPQAFRLSMQALMQDTNDPRFAHPAFWAPFFIVSPE